MADGQTDGDQERWTRREWVKAGLAVGGASAAAALGVTFGPSLLAPSRRTFDDILRYTKFPADQWWNEREGEPIRVTLAQLLHEFPETSIRRAKKILKYIGEVDRVKIDPKRTVTPELERAVSQAVEIPPERRNLREVSVRLGAGILRSKRVLQILKSLERELEIPPSEVTIGSIKDAGWKVRQEDDDLAAEGDLKKRKVREEEPEFVFDVKGPQPVHAAPALSREMSKYAGGAAPDAVEGPPVQRPRVYCSACKIRGASHRHTECGEFLCDVCLERFNQVEHVTAGIKLLCPVCEQPIRDLGEPIAKWDKL